MASYAVYMYISPVPHVAHSVLTRNVVCQVSPGVHARSWTPGFTCCPQCTYKGCVVYIVHWLASRNFIPSCSPSCMHTWLWLEYRLSSINLIHSCRLVVVATFVVHTCCITCYVTLCHVICLSWLMSHITRTSTACDKKTILFIMATDSRTHVREFAYLVCAYVIWI